MATETVPRPTTKAGRQVVSDVRAAIAAIKRDTTEPVVKMWMREVGPSLVEMVSVGVVLTEREARRG